MGVDDEHVHGGADASPNSRLNKAMIRIEQEDGPREPERAHSPPSWRGVHTELELRLLVCRSDDFNRCL
jgi:hypothetical protein